MCGSRTGVRTDSPVSREAHCPSDTRVSGTDRRGRGPGTNRVTLGPRTGAEVSHDPGCPRATTGALVSRSPLGPEKGLTVHTGDVCGSDRDRSTVREWHLPCPRPRPRPRPPPHHLSVFRSRSRTLVFCPTVVCVTLPGPFSPAPVVPVPPGSTGATGVPGPDRPGTSRTLRSSTSATGVGRDDRDRKRRSSPGPCFDTHPHTVRSPVFRAPPGIQNTDGPGGLHPHLSEGPGRLCTRKLFG